MEINEQAFKSELSRIFKANGLSQFLNLEKSEKFLSLTKRMLEENEKYNLTAITDPQKIILNHYADCVKLSAKLSSLLGIRALELPRTVDYDVYLLLGYSHIQEVSLYRVRDCDKCV